MAVAASAGTGGDDALGAGALGREVAPGLHRLAVATGEHRRSPRAGLEARPGPRDGLDHQLRREPRPRGLEPHPGARVRLDLARGLGTARDTPVDANLGGKAGHRIQQPGPHRVGKLQAALGDDRPQPLVAGREPDHLATPAVHEPHMVVLGVAVVGDEACAQAPVVLVDHELGLPPHDVDHRTGLVEDVRVAGKLEQRRLVHAVAQPAVPVAGLPDPRRGRTVLLLQELHRRRRRGEPLQRDRLAGGPRAVPVLMLLARPGHDLAGVFENLPRQPAPAGGRTTLVRRGRLVAGLERQLLQRLQGIFPLRHRRQQEGQRPGAEPRVYRGGLFAVHRRGSGTPFLHPQVGLADDRQTLRQRPGEAVGPYAVHVADQRLIRGLVGVLPELSQPAALQRLQHRPEHRIGEHHRVDACSLARLGGAGHVVHHERLRFALCGGAQERREQRAARRRIVAHQRQQGQGEGRGRGEHVALAGAGPLLGDGRFDVPARLRVVASQHGGEGARAGTADLHMFVLVHLRGQGVEDRVHLVETALKDADECNLRGERRRFRPQLAAGVDDGLGRRRGVDDAHQAARKGAVPAGLGQGAEQAGGAGFGQESPLLRLDRVAVGTGQAAGDGIAAQRHRGPGFVVVVREPGMHVVVTGHDPVQHACAVRLHRQPRRPVQRRPQTVVPRGGVRQPVLHELPGGVQEWCVRQASSPGLDVGVAQYQRDLPRRADMRVHDPVDERRGLGVGRKGLEEAGEVGTVGHVGAHRGDCPTIFGLETRSRPAQAEMPLLTRTSRIRVGSSAERIDDRTRSSEKTRAIAARISRCSSVDSSGTSSPKTRSTGS